MANNKEEARMLVISEQVRSALVSLRLLEEDRLPPVELNSKHVEAVELELECVLPDDILAAFAANTDDLGENAEMDLASVVTHTEDAHRRGCSKERIAVGRQPDDLAYYCIERRKSWNDHPVNLYELDNLDQGVSMQSFGAWLIERAERRRDSLLEGDAQEQKLADLEPNEEQILSFQPQVVLIESAASGKKRSGPKMVHHKTFGTGKVLSETGSGDKRKLEIEFPELGTKVILARFVEE